MSLSLILLLCHDWTLSNNKKITSFRESPTQDVDFVPFYPIPHRWWVERDPWLGSDSGQSDPSTQTWCYGSGGLGMVCRRVWSPCVTWVSPRYLTGWSLVLRARIPWVVQNRWWPTTNLIFWCTSTPTVGTTRGTDDSLALSFRQTSFIDFVLRYAHTHTHTCTPLPLCVPHPSDGGGTTEPTTVVDSGTPGRPKNKELLGNQKRDIVEVN